MKSFHFREIRGEQKHFVVLERIESGMPVMFNTPTTMEE
jgi:hypothetical protein